MLGQIIPLLLTFATFANANFAVENGNITEIQIKTSSSVFAGMTYGHIDLVICGSYDCCLIERLESSNDDFNQGAIDDFVGEDLQGCQNFGLPKNQLNTLLISHRGVDSWLGEYVFVLLDSGVFYRCDIQDWLRGDGEVRLDCVLKKKE